MEIVLIIVLAILVGILLYKVHWLEIMLSALSDDSLGRRRDIHKLDLDIKKILIRLSKLEKNESDDVRTE